MAATKLTAERLREVLHYDPATGIFIWKQPIGQRAQIGRQAGYASTYQHKRRVLRIDGQYFLEHRLAWLYMTGKWPKYEIDHINGDGICNRWNNLREATRSQNLQNLHHARSDSATNEKGVSQLPNGKWRAVITLKGRAIHLGCFVTIDQARIARIEAEQQHFTHAPKR